MPNTLDGGSFKEVWSRNMQAFNEKMDVFRKICDFSEQQNLKEGDVLNKPYRSSMTPQTYTRGTAVTITDLTNTNESLTIDQAWVDPFYVDDLDELQSSYKNIKEYARDSSVDLSNWMDGDVLGEYDQATSSIDDSDISVGGTALNGITLSTSNILKIFSQAKKKLKRLNIFNNLFAAISPDFEAVLMEYLAGKDSALGDSTGTNGHIGKFYGFELYVSNSLGWSATMAMAANPSDDDDIVINGVTITFQTTLTATTGSSEVHITSSADLTRANLVTFLNSDGADSVTEATDAGASSMSAANQALIRGIVAVNNNTADTMTIKMEGRSYVVVTETFSDGTDEWTAALQIQHQLFGKKGAITFIAQKYPTIEIKEVQDKLGKNIIPWILYGLKTFNNDKDKLVDVKVRSDAF